MCMTVLTACASVYHMCVLGVQARDEPLFESSESNLDPLKQKDALNHQANSPALSWTDFCLRKMQLSFP